MKRRWRATSRRRSMPIISSMDREEIDEMIPSRRLSVLVRAVDHIGEEREVQTTPLGREVLEMHKSSLAKAALRSRQSSLSKRRRMMKTAIRSAIRSEEHTSELQSLMRISYAVFCLKKKKQKEH